MANQQNIMNLDSSSVWDIDFYESKIFRDLYASLETKYNAGARDERAKAHAKALKSALNIYNFGVMSIEQIAQSMDLDISELNEYIKDNSNNS